jgi:methionyl aminopeptidase
MSVVIKSPDEIAIMREAGRLNAEIRRILRDAIAPGVTGRELDELAKAEIAKRDAEPTFVGYGPGGRPPYPGAICYSVNAQLVHGIPGDLALREGDIVSIDLGVTYRGYVSDAAFTAAVGEVAPEVERLLERTEAAVCAGIEQARAGQRLGDVSHAIGAVGEAEGYGIIRDYGGHGVGRAMHEPPHIPNFGRPGVGHQLKRGMVLALEPMFTLGGEATEEEADRWTVSMSDGSLCAHFEETIAITEGAAEVLTRMSQLDEQPEGAVEPSGAVPAGEPA